MDFVAGKFVSQVQDLLKSGDENLATLIEAYNWANAHLKEVHKYHTDYTQQWLSAEIKRVFNCDPELYVRAAIHIGGTRDVAGMKTGMNLLRRFGYWECHRADQLLSREQMKSLPSKVTATMEVDAFHEIVETMAEVLRGKRDSGTPDKVDYKREYLRLVQENAKLKQEVADLRANLKWIESQVQVIAK
jgi:hypothetical protein